MLKFGACPKCNGCIVDNLTDQYSYCLYCGYVDYGNPGEYISNKVKRKGGKFNERARSMGKLQKQAAK